MHVFLATLGLLSVFVLVGWSVRSACRMRALDLRVERLEDRVSAADRRATADDASAASYHYRYTRRIGAMEETLRRYKYGLPPCPRIHIDRVADLFPKPTAIPSEPWPEDDEPELPRVSRWLDAEERLRRAASPDDE